MNPSTTDSWTEGFAEFYSTLVSRQMARDSQPGLYRMAGFAVNLDVNYASFSYLGQDPVADEEIAIASLLWDLVDTAGDEDDLRPMGVSQDLLDTWGFRFVPPGPGPVPPIAPRMPVLYGDRVHIGAAGLLFIIENADKLPNASVLRSYNAALGYNWIFDVDHLYRVLKAMGVGQFPGSHGLTALDELFVTHGFFADTSPQNLTHDPGETIGQTDNARYWVGGARSWVEVPARSPRFSPAPVPDAYLRYTARDRDTGEPAELAGFEVTVKFEPRFAHYDYMYDAQPTVAGELPLVAPDPAYASTIRVTPYGDHLKADAPFEVTGRDYWTAVGRSAGPAILEHTFDVQGEPYQLWMPLAVKYAGPIVSVPGGKPAPPTPPSSAAFAAELVRLVNAERARAGKAPLTVQAQLSAAAEWYATDTALSGDYRPDHTDRQGRVMPERLVDFGYGPEGQPRWQVAENIARGQTTPAEVLADWLASPPHRANLWDGDLCEIGAAHAYSPRDSYHHYWVVDFGCRVPAAARPVIPSPGSTPGSTLQPSPSVTARRTQPTEPTQGSTAGPTASGSVTPRPTITPGATVEPGLGIQGRVTAGGVPVMGVTLVLRRVAGGCETEMRMAQTWEYGRYAFADVPSLGAGETYYVYYPNDEEDPNRVGRWYGPDIAAYREGDSIHGGDFDIANVDLVTPAHGATVELPFEFRWARRTFRAYSYKWILYDEATGQRWASSDLGDSDSFTLTAPPKDAAYDRDYRWFVRIYQTPDSFGTTYYWRTVRFTEQTGPEWVVVNSDDFCDPSSGWPSGDTATERYGYSAGPECFYQILLRAAEGLRVPRLQTSGDFAVEADGYPIGAGAFGLLFGLTPQGDRYYVYQISTGKRYSLSRYDAGSYTTVVPWTDSARVDPDFGNTLRVERVDGELRLLLDGDLLTSVADGRDHDGWVGLWAQTDLAGFEARFTGYLVERAR